MKTQKALCLWLGIQTSFFPYIRVDTLKLKKKNKYQPIKSWKEQQELYEGGGG
jgi:hypothetical protein